MSWNVREVNGPTGNTEDIRKLEAAINTAADGKILMFGAACDVKESSSDDKWMPCDSTKVWYVLARRLSISSCNCLESLKSCDCP